MGAADAFLKYGSADSWPPVNRAPSMSLGVALGHGSWPIWPGWDPTRATQTIRVWRNPDTSNGDLWWQPARFGTVDVWKPAQATGWFLFDFLRQVKQYGLDLEAVRRPAILPWGPNWTGAGGTQAASSDNGLLIDTVKSGQSGWEIQGLAPLNAWDVALINARALAPVARIGDYRCDGLYLRSPKSKPHGSQGPWSKRDGLMRPDYLTGPSTMPLRVVVFNAACGSKATPAPGGWVEHREDRQPYPGHKVTLPLGNDPRMVPPWQGFRIEISNEDISRWLDSEAVAGRLRESMRQFAENLRGDGKRVTLRVAESGTGDPIIESSGAIEPTDRAAWAAAGVDTPELGWKLGRNLFRFARLVEAA